MPEVAQNEKFWIPTNFNQHLYFTNNDLMSHEVKYLTFFILRAFVVNQLLILKNQATTKRFASRGTRRKPKNKLFFKKCNGGPDFAFCL